MQADIFSHVEAGFTKDPVEQKRLLENAYPTYDLTIKCIQEHLDSDEMAFRRGYHHAVVFLEEQLKGRVDERQQEYLANYEQRVHDWRYHKDMTTDTPPGHWGYNPK